MYPISHDLVRAMDDERRRSLRRHVRRRSRRPADAATPARRRESLIWTDETGSAHLVDRDGVARVQDDARSSAPGR